MIPPLWLTTRFGHRLKCAVLTAGRLAFPGCTPRAGHAPRVAMSGRFAVDAAFSVAKRDQGGFLCHLLPTSSHLTSAGWSAIAASGSVATAREVSSAPYPETSAS